MTTTSPVNFELLIQQTGLSSNVTRLKAIEVELHNLETERRNLQQTIFSALQNIMGMAGIPSFGLSGAYNGLAPSGQLTLEEVEKEAHDKVLKERFIEAIKFLREHLGTGLRDSKEIVDAWRASKAAVPPLRYFASKFGVDLSKLKQGVSAPAATALKPTATEEEIVERFCGPDDYGLINSIRWVRAVTGLGLKEAKDRVDKAVYHNFEKCNATGALGVTWKQNYEERNLRKAVEAQTPPPPPAPSVSEIERLLWTSGSASLESAVVAALKHENGNPRWAIKLIRRRFHCSLPEALRKTRKIAEKRVSDLGSMVIVWPETI